MAESYYNKTISDEELRKKCVEALEKGWSGNALHMQLKADRYKLGTKRFYKIWNQVAIKAVVRHDY